MTLHSAPPPARHSCYAFHKTLGLSETKGVSLRAADAPKQLAKCLARNHFTRVRFASSEQIECLRTAYSELLAADLLVKEL